MSDHVELVLDYPVVMPSQYQGPFDGNLVSRVGLEEEFQNCC